MTSENVSELSSAIFALLSESHKKHGLTTAEAIGILTFINYKLMGWAAESTSGSFLEPENQ
jgi:hypothetical protein